jgi:hypothetical protein
MTTPAARPFQATILLSIPAAYAGNFLLFQTSPWLSQSFLQYVGKKESVSGSLVVVCSLLSLLLFGL